MSQTQMLQIARLRLAYGLTYAQALVLAGLAFGEERT